MSLYCRLLRFFESSAFCATVTHTPWPTPSIPVTLLSTNVVYVRAGGGEIDGRVTRAEWREHHLHVSALIADDDVFCEHVKRVWGCGHGEEVDPDTSNGIHTHIRSSGGLLRTDNNSSIPRSSSVRGQEGASAFVDISNGNTAAPKGNGCEKTSPRPALAGAREAWGPNPPPQLVSNAERGPILWRGNVSARDGTATRLAMPPGILGLLERARGSLAAGGMRAAFELLKGFREEDRRANGKVTLSGFKTAMGGSSLGLKEAEMRIVFQVRFFLKTEVLFESCNESPFRHIAPAGVKQFLWTS